MNKTINWFFLQEIVRVIEQHVVLFLYRPDSFLNFLKRTCSVQLAEQPHPQHQIHRGKTPLQQFPPLHRKIRHCCHHSNGITAMGFSERISERVSEFPKFSELLYYSMSGCMHKFSEIFTHTHTHTHTGPKRAVRAPAGREVRKEGGEEGREGLTFRWLRSRCAGADLNSESTPEPATSGIVTDQRGMGK